MVRARKQLLTAPNLTDVESGGGGFHIPEGEYAMEVANVELVESKTSNNEMWKFTILGKEGKAKGKKFLLHCVLTEASLWKLKQTLEALGVEIPDSDIELDPDDLIGIGCVGVVIDREFEGKTFSNLDKIIASDDAEVEEEVKEEIVEPVKRAVGRPKKAVANNGKKEPVKFAAEDIKDMSEDELDSLVEKHDLDIDLSKFNTLRRKANAVLTGLEAINLLSE